MRWKLHQGKKGWQRGRARPEKHLETHACVYSFYLFPAFWFSLFCCLFLCPFHSPPFTPMLSLLCLFSFVFFPLWWFLLSRELIPSCLYPNSLYTLYSPMWPALFGSHYTWHQHASPHDSRSNKTMMIHDYLSYLPSQKLVQNSLSVPCTFFVPRMVQNPDFPLDQSS